MPMHSQKQRQATFCIRFHPEKGSPNKKYRGRKIDPNHNILCFLPVNTIIKHKISFVNNKLRLFGDFFAFFAIFTDASKTGRSFGARSVPDGRLLLRESGLWGIIDVIRSLPRPADATAPRRRPRRRRAKRSFPLSRRRGSRRRSPQALLLAALPPRPQGHAAR